jgi:hypothetical protein
VSVYKTSPDVDEVTFAISDPSSFDVHASSGSPAKVRISFLYFDEDRIKGYSTGLSPNECPDFDLNQLKGTTTDLVPEMLCEIVPNQS